MTSYSLTPPVATHFAQLALSHVRREYPNKLDHVLLTAEDVQGPAALHPVFYGSFDWHSCVHGYWVLATLLRREPDAVAEPIIALGADGLAVRLPRGFLAFDALVAPLVARAVDPVQHDGRADVDGGRRRRAWLVARPSGGMPRTPEDLSL